MGFTGLARWQNAPPEGLALIQKNILSNHRGAVREKWHMTIKSFRSNMGAIPGLERSMSTVTMKDNVFVIVEDPAAPSRSEIMQQPPGEAPPYNPSHYRQTYITVTPPGSLEQLLDQLRAPWVTTRNHPQGAGGPQKLQDSGVQLSISGHVYTVGTDWIVRAGNVALAGGTIKGLLLEGS
ncbi:hypothetical protein QCA50_000471 [Cerrena zonata]|uniref:Mediator of RNA polymerase II transcription subunit 20 n=1 Tax=Cerrena zonata TaxID=2478898 RepID=A0AAW0GQD5_9APHY